MGRHSDRTGERVLHVALPALVSFVGLYAAGWIKDSTAGMGLLAASLAVAAALLVGRRFHRAAAPSLSG